MDVRQLMAGRRPHFRKEFDECYSMCARIAMDCCFALIHSLEHSALHTFGL